MREQPLEKWETWPLWALGLSNGLNIALWYVLSMARVQAPEVDIVVPGLVSAWLPWVIVIGGIAAAVSLDGVLIATIAGMRHGRRGLWSVLTIIGAAVFSGAIAYAVHAGVLNEVPILHVAQAAVLALYNLHLSQRKALQSDDGPASRSASSIVKVKSGQQASFSTSRLAHQDGFKCSKCGAILESATAVRNHQRDECLGRLEPLDLRRDLSASMQQNGRYSTSDAE
jgi:hypothetical protein